MDATCDKALEKLQSIIENEGFDDQTLENLKEDYPACSSELDRYASMWTELGGLSVPEPSASLQRKVLGSIDEMDRMARKKSGVEWLKWAAVFVMGLFIGLTISDNLPIAQDGNQANGNLTTLKSHGSAMERLTALQEIKSMSAPRDAVFAALGKTMLEDPNVNVRLSAVEALVHFADNPKARELLIEALPRQDAPIVQLTMAEVLIKLQDKASIDEIRRMINEDKFDFEVGLHLREKLSEL